MSLLTPADLQALGIGLDLDTAALQGVIDAEEAELVRRFGPNYPGPQTETVLGRRGASLFLMRAIESVTSIVSYLYLGDTVPVTLVAADYLIWNDEGRVQRVPTGPNAAAYWGERATVVYVPFDDTALRKSVLVQLVGIGVAQSASSESGGSVSGLGFSVGASSSNGSSAGGASDPRSAAYARLSWLSQ